MIFAKIPVANKLIVKEDYLGSKKRNVGMDMKHSKEYIYLEQAGGMTLAYKTYTLAKAKPLR